jgi:hypothetical protein
MKRTTEKQVWNVLIIYALSIFTLAIMLASCKSTKYVNCDAYKTRYKPVKAERHHHHVKCDAYN